MRILTLEKFFDLLPKINILLIVCAALLTVGLYSSISRTYDSSNVRSRNKIKRPLELMAPAVISEAIPLFQEDIFKRKQLFAIAGSKKTEQERSQFKLLGISTGKKNIAVIQDIRANKSYYCSEGDMINDLKVKEILKDKVILVSDTDTLEINR